MMHKGNRLTTRLLVPLALLLLVAGIADAREEAYWEQARKLYMAGQVEETLAELDRLLEDRKEDALLFRLRGICLMDLEMHQESLAALETAVALAPGNVASLYYHAQALAYAGRIGESVSQLRRVIELEPESTYAEQAAGAMQSLENIRVSMQPSAPGKRGSVYARVAVEHDNNIPARSSHDQADMEDRVDSARLIASLYLEAIMLDQQAVSWAPFTAGLKGSAYFSRHEEQVFKDWNLDIYSGGVFIRRAGRFFSSPLNIEVSGGYTGVDLDGETYSQSHDVSGTLALQLSSWAVFSVKGAIVWQDFENDTDYPEWYSRDGTDQSAGIHQTFYALDHRIVLDLGYKYRVARTDGSQFQIDSHQGSAALHLALPGRIRFRTTFSYAEEDYLEYSPEPRRLDDVYSVSASLSRALWKNLGISLDYTRTTSASTMDFAEFERDVYGIALYGSL